MSAFKTGYSSIDTKTTFKKNDFIVITGRPAIGKTCFSMNLVLNNTKKQIALIFLELTEGKIENRLNWLRRNGEDLPDIEDCFHYLEQPSLLELFEYIVSIKDKYDTFIIDDMSGIDSYKTNCLGENKKKYHYILRHLKVLCRSLNKNIVLLANVTRKIERGKKKFSFYHHLSKEKYMDYLIIIHRPSYYGIEEIDKKDSYIYGYDDEKLNGDEMYLTFVKYLNPIKESIFKFKFNSYFKRIYSYPDPQLPCADPDINSFFDYV